MQIWKPVYQKGWSIPLVIFIFLLKKVDGCKSLLFPSPKELCNIFRLLLLWVSTASNAEWDRICAAVAHNNRTPDPCEVSIRLAGVAVGLESIHGGRVGASGQDVSGNPVCVRVADNNTVLAVRYVKVNRLLLAGRPLLADLKRQGGGEDVFRTCGYALGNLRVITLVSIDPIANLFLSMKALTVRELLSEYPVVTVTLAPADPVLPTTGDITTSQLLK